jgi:hypothetical protein
MTLYIGVDPGRAGAVAIVGPAWRFEACRLSGSHRTVYDWLRSAIREDEHCVAYLEQVHAFPTDARSRAFNFGASYGACQMLLAATVGAWTEVAPLRWQNAMGCRTGGDKRVSRDFCRKQFPHLKIVKWNADAFLIAEYAKKVSEENEE